MNPREDPRRQWARYRQALGDEPLPAALLDLDALEANLERLLEPVRAGGKTLRLATKSIRSLDVIRRVLARGGGVVRGLMAFTAAETAFLAGEGFDDLLLAYPTLHPADLAKIVEANRSATAAVVVDAPEQVAALDGAGRSAGLRLPAVVEVDLGWRPLGGAVHLGARRSPLRTVDDVVALAARVADSAGLRFHGVMAYESQIAGMTDRSPFARLTNGPKRAIKRGSRGPVESLRRALDEALRARGLAPTVFNGGGTGSLGWASGEVPLTEVTAGSGLYAPHLFDYYRDLALEPAACFALQAVRRPAPGLVTCHGGGFVASGEAGPDRLPVPWLPAGLSLLGLEGAGEVQTPLRVPAGVEIALGEPVFFRHAKAGELCEHFDELLCVRGDRVESRARTYRGLGHCFLG